MTAPPTWQAALAAVAALSPVAATALGLAAMRPPPAQPPNDQELLVVAAPAATATVAARHPGRAAIALADLPAPPQFAALPFRRLLAPDEPALAGPPAGAAPPTWTLLGTFASWRPTVEHGAAVSPCPHPLADGGRGCGGGIRFLPELRVLDGLLRPVLAVTAIPVGSGAALTVVAPPEGLVGTLWSLGDGAASLWLSRGGVSLPLRCAQGCSFALPPGDGPLTLSLAGPNPPLALQLGASSSGWTPQGSAERGGDDGDPEP